MADLLNLETMHLTFTWINPTGYKTLLASNYMTVSAVTGRATVISFINIPFTMGSTFYLQKSGSVNSGWRTIAALTTNDSSYIDLHANNTYNRHENEFYRLVSPINKNIIGVAKSEGYVDPYGAEIARRHRIQLVNGRAGNKVYVFKRMHNDTHCPNCWDDILQKRSRVNCSLCNSTGFIHGYYNPIKTFISFGPENISVTSNIDGPATAPNAVQCWGSNYPLLTSGDLVLEPGSNRFWSISNTGLTMCKRVVTKQDFTLQREDGDDPLYSLINRLPTETEEAGAYGESIFQDDAEISAGIRYSGSTKIL